MGHHEEEKTSHFQSLSKCVQVTVKSKLIGLREEKGLMTRLLVVSRQKSEIDISELF